MLWDLGKTSAATLVDRGGAYSLKGDDVATAATNRNESETDVESLFPSKIHSKNYIIQ